MYFSDDGDLLALRFDNWKVVFMEQRCRARCRSLGRAVRRAPRAQALQPAHGTRSSGRHHVEHLLRLVFDNDYIALAATAVIAQFLDTFEEFPPRQKAASFTIDQAVERLEAALTTGH